MRRSTVVGGAVAAVAVLVALAAGYRALVRRVELKSADPSATRSSVAPETDARPASASDEGYLYGRVTTPTGTTYEGRLRFGGDEEAFWGDYFNGWKRDNPWVALVPPERRPRERSAIEVFGLEVFARERELDLGRPFMARFGDLARIEASGRDVSVTLKSGTRFDLDRLEASDFDDGLRVWDDAAGALDLDSLAIRAIELVPTPHPTAAPYRLHGTVRTRGGDFTGFLQWNREESVGSDELDGYTAAGERLGLRFDTLRSIARRSPESALATTLDGREILLAGTREVGHGHRGVYVDDARYGRVLVSWEAFERVDLDAPESGASGPAYDDFAPGAPLVGSVETSDGRRLSGRLVFDLDESETTETLDAPAEGVDYTILFGKVAAIVPAGSATAGGGRARVALRSGEELELEPRGDLGEGNAGLLVFVDGAERPEYVPWSEVGRIDFEPPPAAESAREAVTPPAPAG
ncbi:MAG: hypothetical protein H6511_01275 [Holophagales bacterium]|nr:hypothetical protein [Holophagales bacterium]